MDSREMNDIERHLFDRLRNDPNFMSGPFEEWIHHEGSLEPLGWHWAAGDAPLTASLVQVRGGAADGLLAFLCFVEGKERGFILSAEDEKWVDLVGLIMQRLGSPYFDAGGHAVLRGQRGLIVARDMGALPPWHEAFGGH